MIYSLMNELNKIIDAVNERKIRFVIKYGIIKAMLFTLFLCIVFAILGAHNFDFLTILLNTLIKLVITIIPGTIWGLVDYQMYRDIVTEKRKYTITNVLYVFVYGFLGWGMLCGSCNVSFIPYDGLSVISALITLPIYGILLGIVSRKALNTKMIKQLYIENIKGKNITKVQRKGSVVKMK